MDRSRQCTVCQRSYVLGPDTVAEITQVERLIALKEGLNAWRVKKLTCPHCGTASLVDMDVALVAGVPAAPAGASTPEPDPGSTAAAFPFGTRFDQFIPLWPYVWPSLCACCYGPASGTLGVAATLTIGPLEKAVGKQEARMLIHQLAGRVPNLKVTDTPGSKLMVELRVPCCGRCRAHESLGFAGILGYVSAASILSLFLAGLALAGVLAIFSKHTREGLLSLGSSPWLGRMAIGAGVVAMLAVLGWVVRAVGNASRRDRCAPLQKAVELEEGGGLVGWIQFGNADYARAFARANDLTPVGAAPGAQRASERGPYLQ